MQKNEIKVGQRIEQIAHPEYGQWYIKSHYGEGMWEVFKCGKADGIVTCEGELTKFWKVVT